MSLNLPNTFKHIIKPFIINTILKLINTKNEVFVFLHLKNCDFANE